MSGLDRTGASEERTKSTKLVKRERTDKIRIHKSLQIRTDRFILYSLLLAFAASILTKKRKN